MNQQTWFHMKVFGISLSTDKEEEEQGNNLLEKCYPLHGIAIYMKLSVEDCLQK